MTKLILAVVVSTMLSMTVWAQEPEQPNQVPTAGAGAASVETVESPTPNGNSGLPGPAVFINQYLGVRLEATPAILAMHMPLLKRAAVVTQVDPLGLAAQHAIRVGNIILAADDRLVDGPSALATASPATLLVYQEGQPKQISLPGNGQRVDVGTMGTPSTTEQAAGGPTARPLSPILPAVQTVNVNTPHGSRSS